MRSTCARSTRVLIPSTSRRSVALYKDIDNNRLPTVHSVDVRFGKVIKIKRANINVDLDVFNIGNAGTILGRQYNRRLTGATGFNQVLEIMNPRILRLGLRFNF